MTSSTWLAVVLCCFVWFVYMRWFAPRAATRKCRPITPTAVSSSNSVHGPRKSSGRARTAGDRR